MWIDRLFWRIIARVAHTLSMSVSALLFYPINQPTFWHTAYITCLLYATQQHADYVHVPQSDFFSFLIHISGQTCKTLRFTFYFILPFCPGNIGTSDEMVEMSGQLCVQKLRKLNGIL